MGRFIVTAISAATGVCFAVLAGLSISAILRPFRTVHPFSFVIAAVSVYLGYIAFRASTSGRTDEMTVVTSLRRGIMGAFVGLIAMAAVLILFRTDTNPFLAHALGNPAYSFTDYRLLAAAVLLGFGIGFVIAMPKTRA